MKWLCLIQTLSNVCLEEESVVLISKCWVPTLHYIVFHNGLYNIITFEYNAVIHNLQSFWAVLMNYHVKLNLKCDSNNISEQQRKLYQERNCCLLQVITCNAENVFLKMFDSHK